MRGDEKILFVDDEDFLVEIGEKILKHLGYNATAVTSSSEALKLFTDNPRGFDLIITDQKMPGMTGIELSRKMIALRPDIPIILCTGFSEQVPEKELASYGIKRYLLKPLVMKNISVAVRHTLDKKH